MVDRLQDFCGKELEGANFPDGKPETHLLKGDAGQEILALAEKIDADLIAMGTRRHSRAGELLDELCRLQNIASLQQTFTAPALS